MRLAIVNHLDAVSPSVHATAGGTASEAVGFPATNTQLLGRGDVWRSKDTSQTGGALAEVEWKYSFPSTRAANWLMLLGHNLAGGTVRLKLYSDNAYTTSVYDSAALTVPAAASADAGASFGLSGIAAGNSDDLFGNLQPYELFFTATAFQSAKITIATGPISTAQGFLSLGRNWLALYNEFDNPNYGMQISNQSNTVNTRTRGGSLRGNVGETWRRLDMSLGGIRTEAQRIYWTDVTRYAQNARDVIVNIFAGYGGRQERDYRLNGKAVSLDPLIYDVAYRTQHLVIEEL